jgi:hypothetical protein
VPNRESDGTRQQSVDHYRIVKGVFNAAANGQLDFATIL